MTIDTPSVPRLSKESRPKALKAAALGLLAFAAAGVPDARAQRIPFDRADFGKIVLTQRQSTNGVELEQAIGTYSNEFVNTLNPRTRIRRLGRAVGRLDILTDRSPGTCTAFIVSDRHIVTNHHCVPGRADAQGPVRVQAVQFVTGYVKNGVAKGTARFNVSITPIESDEKLDYAVLEVFGDPSRDWGRLKLAPVELASGLPFWIIGHPMGEAQRVSRERCQSDEPAVASGRLRHTCDTLGGNSGSPVIDADTGRVVALHHAGSKRDEVNFAIPMTEIVRHSRVLRDLAGGDVTTPTQRPGREPSQTTVAATNDGRPANCNEARADYDRAAGENTATAYRAHIDRFGTCPYAAVARDLLKAVE